MARESLLSLVVRGLCIALYRLRGWTLEGKVPQARKFVIVGAPHTSNRDFMIFLAATHELGVRPSFIGKHTLFRWPLKRLMDDMGGIPIDRSKPANYVDQVTAEFAARDDLALVIAPEGTRNSDGHWKSGFYHIATAAGVAIVPAWLNLARRRINIGEPMVPSGDYPADLHKLASFYRACEPDNPRFREIERQALAKPALSKASKTWLGGAS